jgi:hypothetical protein
MTFPRLFLACLLVAFVAGIHPTLGQTSQSAIYDATALMNAKRGINVLLIPSSSGFNVVNPVTGQTDTTNVTAIPPYLNNPSGCLNTIVSILARIANVHADTASVRAAYKDNPFLRTILNRTDSLHPDFTRAPAATVAAIAAPTNVGNETQNAFTNIANGIADFLIARAQEEISISVFAKLQQFISRYPELDTLFPKTVALIKPVQAYDYNKTLQALKDAINQDLSNLIPRIALLYNIPRYQLLNQRVPAMTLVFAASTVVSDFDGKHKIGYALHDLGSQPYIKQVNDYARVLQLISILSNSLRAKQLTDKENGDYPYITPDFISSVTHNDANQLLQVS